MSAMSISICMSAVNNNASVLSFSMVSSHITEPFNFLVIINMLRAVYIIFNQPVVVFDMDKEIAYSI